MGHIDISNGNYDAENFKRAVNGQGPLL